ncbi:MAG: tetratricopeptide repeat protein [Candidatus Omnitrophica bacterium]|nr:tetratricopeptide repeat protein [Candidatus Omnitrophota bacterium]
MLSLRFLSILASVFLTLLVLKNLDAVTDIYSGRIGPAERRGLAQTKRSTTPLAKSIAHYTMGIIYDNELRAEDAIKQYEAAIKIEPDVSYLHTRLAVDYFLTKDVEKALEELTKAKFLDPADPKPRFLAALIYTSSHRFEEAQKEYQEIMKLSPDSIWALSSLADVLMLQEKMGEAAAIYERLIEKEKNSPLLYFNLAFIYSKMGKAEDGIKALEEAIKLKPDYLEAYIGLGVLYETKKDMRGAIKNFEKALELDPVNTNIYHHLGYLFYKDKKYDEAIRLYQTLVKLDSDDVRAYVEWANVYLAQKKADEAIAILEQATDTGLKDVELYLALGYAYSLRNDDGRTLKFYNMAQELAPDEPWVHFYLGSFYEKIGQKETAETKFRKAIALDQGFAEAYNYLGYMFAESGENLDEAVDLVKKALEKDPDNGAYLDSLGWAYFKKGMLDEALRELERAINSEPDDPTITDHLGDVYMKKGLQEKARQMWERSLKLDPKQEKVQQKLRTAK